MKRIKKRYLVLVGMIIWLGGCWIIGQPRREMRNAELTQDEQQYNTNIPENITFEGYKEVNDNPWNMTVGIFEMEGEGTCILLTPNTSMVINNVSGKGNEYNIKYQIHPWVKESSDGAGLLVWILNDNEEILYEEEILINSELDWNVYSLNCSQFEGAQKLKIVCNNGVNEDDSADWVVMKVQDIDLRRPS